MRRNCSSSDHFHHTPVWDICHRKNRQIYKPKGKEKEKWKLEKKRGRGVVSGVFGFHCFQFSFTVSASHSWHLHTDGCCVHKASTAAQDLPGLRSAWTHGQRWEIKVIEQSHCQQRRMGGGGREVVGREEDGGRNKVEGKQSTSGERQVGSGGRRKRGRALTLSGPSSSPCTGGIWAWGSACWRLWCRSGRPGGRGRGRGRPAVGRGRGAGRHGGEKDF